ncbi:YbaB/EbfC family nucleoid-associated protein [Streptosporangium soli]|nr:YbaB/EbfC family nucleoid-associated protein [Streptosporangium sp. KLBMP 9127]
MELQHLERTLEQAQKIMLKLEEAQARILRVVGDGEGADGLVKVASDGQGGIKKIHFNPRIMRLDSTTLGQEVTAAIQAAQQQAERQSQEIMSEVLALTAAMPEPPDETFVRERVEEVARQLY